MLLQGIWTDVFDEDNLSAYFVSCDAVLPEVHVLPYHTQYCFPRNDFVTMSCFNNALPYMHSSPYHTSRRQFCYTRHAKRQENFTCNLHAYICMHMHMQMMYHFTCNLTCNFTRDFARDFTCREEVKCAAGFLDDLHAGERACLKT